MLAFLDRERAFNKVITEAINNALVKLRTNKTLRDWVSNMVSDRIVGAELGHGMNQ